MTTLTFLSPLLLILVLSNHAESLPSINLMKNMYSLFTQKYGRVHKSEAEASERFAIFMKSVHEIEQLNKRNDGAKYGINQFSDWTDEERSHLFVNISTLRKDIGKLPLAKIEKTVVPDSYDWRARGIVSPVKDQGQCGSCYAFSSAAVVESLYAQKTGQVVDLSEQQLVDCTPNALGCRGGNPVFSLQYIQSRGAQLESQNPYRQMQGYCNGQNGQIFVNNVVQIIGENAMTNFIFTHAPLAMTLRAPQSIMHYMGGIYRPSPQECYSTNEGHAVEVVGYGVENGVKYWLAKNSWGTSHGEYGYLKMIRGQNACDNEVQNFGASM